MNGSRQQNAGSADEATQGGEAQRDFTWVEASVWTERMLSALGNGGHRFFGLRQGKVDAAGHGRDRRKGEASAGANEQDFNSLDAQREASETQALERQERTGVRFERERVYGRQPGGTSRTVDPPPRRSRRTGARGSEGPGLAGPVKTRRVYTCPSSSLTPNS